MFQSILLAVDLNDLDGGKKAADAAVALCAHENATLHVLSVVPDDGMAIVSASMSAGHNKAAIDTARADLTAWANGALPEAVTWEVHVVRGTVYDQIIKRAAELEVDGIVVGAHRPSFADYLLGTNAARVARHATQSVFIIR